MDYPIHLPDQLRSHLKSLRKTKNLTQAQLGKLLGVGQVRIAEIEQNPAAISVEQLIKLLAALEAQVVLRSSSPSAARPPANSADRKGVW